MTENRKLGSENRKLGSENRKLLFLAVSDDIDWIRRNLEDDSGDTVVVGSTTDDETVTSKRPVVSLNRGSAKYSNIQYFTAGLVMPRNIC